MVKRTGYCDNEFCIEKAKQIKRKYLIKGLIKSKKVTIMTQHDCG